MNSWKPSLLVSAVAAGFSLLSLPAALAADVTKAIAIITPTAGNKTGGKVTFSKEGDGVKVVAEVTGLEPGEHGFHIHEFGDLSAPDGMSTGGHFNPHKTNHGAPNAAEHHAGDFGNLKADASGNAKLEITLKDLKLDGDHSILGHAIVVHGKADDLKSQPAGNAGPRVGHGVIGVAKP